MHMWHHVTDHLITSNDKDFNSENRIKLRVRDTHPSFVKLVHFITRLVQAVHSITRRRSSSPISTHTSLSVQPSTRTPSPVLPIDSVGSQAPIPQRSHSPPASSAIPVSPASSSSSLVDSSEASTVGENEFEMPQAAIRARLEEEFIEQFAVFKPQDTPEQ
jgi:hypothetical protein